VLIFVIRYCSLNLFVWLWNFRKHLNKIDGFILLRRSVVLICLSLFIIFQSDNTDLQNNVFSCNTNVHMFWSFIHNFTRNINTLSAPISEYNSISLLCPNNCAIFFHRSSQCDIYGQTSISAHYQRCHISSKSKFPFIPAIVQLLKIFPMIANPPMLAWTLLNIKSQIYCLSCLLTNSYNVTKRVSAVPERYDKCQLLQPLNEPCNPSQLSNQVMRTADSLQILSPLPAALQSVATLSITYTCSTSPSNCTLYPAAQIMSLCELCGPLVMLLIMWQNVVINWQTVKFYRKKIYYNNIY